MLGRSGTSDAVEQHGLLADRGARERALPAPGWRRRFRTAPSTCSRYQRRNFCALTTSDAGTIAPAIRRSRTARLEIARARAQPVEMQRWRPRLVVMTIGRGPRPRRLPGISTSRLTPSASATRATAASASGRRAALEIAAGDGDAQSRRCRARRAAPPARPADRRRRDRRGRGPAWRRRRAPGRASCAPAGPR